MMIMDFFKRVLMVCLLEGMEMIADDKVEVYGCYGNPRYIVVEGRVFDSRVEQNQTQEDGYLVNIKNKFAQLFNDEKEHEAVTIALDGRDHLVLSDDEGYFEFEFSTSKDHFFHAQSIKVSINQGETVTNCNAFIPSSQEQVGVISDFDDTLVISDVADKFSLLGNIFLKNYKQRTLIKSMQEIVNRVIGKEHRAFFLITGSPKQLHNSIDHFLDHHNFPKRTIITKKLHGDNSDPLFDQLEYKFEKVKKLILLYPNIQWVLLGDSGEMDKEVYTQIQKAYPNRVKNIYIRNVDTNRIEKIF